MSLGNTQVANQNTYVAPFTINLPAEADYVYVDTSATASPSSITLPYIEGCGFLGISKRYIITDVSGNAADSPITILPSGGDEINFAASFVINENGASVMLQVVSGNRWMAVNNMASGGGSTVNIYNSNGTLTGDRTLDGGGNTLTYTNLNNLYATTLGNIEMSAYGPLMNFFANETLQLQGVSNLLAISPLLELKASNSARLWAINSINSKYARVQPFNTGELILDTDIAGNIQIRRDDSTIYILPTTAPTVGQVVGAVDGAGTLGWLDSNGNIYTDDGTLTANRTLTGNGYNLTFKSIPEFRINAENFAALTAEKFVYVRVGGDSDDSTVRISSKQPIAIENAGVLAYSLPITDGSAGQVLTTNGAGVSRWKTLAGAGFATYDNYAAGQNIGLAGTYVYMDTLGYTGGHLGTAAAAFPLTATVFLGDFYDNLNKWSIDAAAISEAHLSMELEGGCTAMYSQTNRVYYADMFTGGESKCMGIPLPRTDQRANTIQQFKLFGNNCKIYMGPNLGAIDQGSLFFRVPANQEDADSLYLDCSIHIQDYQLQNTNGLTTRTNGIRLAASNSPYFLNIKSIGFYYGFHTQFCLGMMFQKCLATNCSFGYLNDEGDWLHASSGATVSQILWESCRAYCVDGGVGWRISNADNSRMISCWGEGSTSDSVQAMVWWSNNGQSTVKNFSVQGFRCEMPVDEAVFYFEGDNMGTAQIENVFIQQAQTIVSLNNLGSTTNTVNLRNTNINTVPYNIANQGGNGGAWIFENFYLLGDGAGNFPVTPAQIVNTALFPYTWRSGISPLSTSPYTTPDANPSIYRVQIPIVRPF